MPKVIFLVGLCGAGKTRKARQMEKEGLVFVEGFHGDPRQHQKLVDSLRTGKDCVAEELQTLTAQYRACLEAYLQNEIPGLQVKFWFFERDIIKATLNVLSRPDEKIVADHILINGRVYDHYEIPTDPNTVILPIERPTLWPSGPPGIRKLRLILIRTVLILAWFLLLGVRRK